MSLVEHYSDFKWIKVKRYPGYDQNIPAEENYAILEHHHTKETSFLIEEIKKLAAEIDRLKSAPAPEPHQ